MKNTDFINAVKEQLEKMSESEKDEWILKNAKLISESEQQSFMMSLTGEKKITYMPTQSEIEEFCEKVRDGDIYVEYETHYYEFDDDGRYMDDWKVWHNDPHKAFEFLDKIFYGCHDLMILGEYATAADLLNEVCNLEFKVIVAEASEDVESIDSDFTISDAVRENLITREAREIGFDWIMALLSSEKSVESYEFAKKLINVFQHKLCKKLNPSVFNDIISDKLFQLMEGILEKEIEEANKELAQIQDESRNWHKRYELKQLISRKQELLLNIQMKARKEKVGAETQKNVSILASSWKQICELLQILRYERYIDDQWEIEEVWNICEALIKKVKFEEEAWELRKSILTDIIAHGYYNSLGCYDPIKNLFEKLCVRSEEYLECADIMNQYSCYAKEAAELYRQYGRIDHYIAYLENHLNKSSKEYVELIQYYSERGNVSGALEVAELGLEKCKDDLTDIFIYLLKEAKKSADGERYKKLYASAKRRKYADIVRIDEALRNEIMRL